jgi:transcriptional regulator with XRE-family HTH domain
MPPEEPRDRFARVIREAREQRGWTQDDLAENADVSRPTVQRYEGGKTATPEPEKARQIFRALGLDPRLIPVLLGYVTAEEMGVDPIPPRVFSRTTEDILAILEDPKVSAAQKVEWLNYFRYVTRTIDIVEAPRAG